MKAIKPKNEREAQKEDICNWHFMQFQVQMEMGTQVDDLSLFEIEFTSTNFGLFFRDLVFLVKHLAQTYGFVLR